MAVVDPDSDRLRAADDPMRRAIYHQALLRYIGCNADTHLQAAAWGDEIALRRELQGLDFGDKAEFAAVFIRAITRLFAGAPPDELVGIFHSRNSPLWFYKSMVMMHRRGARIPGHGPVRKPALR